MWSCWVYLSHQFGEYPLESEIKTEEQRNQSQEMRSDPVTGTGHLDPAMPDATYSSIGQLKKKNPFYGLCQFDFFFFWSITTKTKTTQKH